MIAMAEIRNVQCVRTGGASNVGSKEMLGSPTCTALLPSTAAEQWHEAVGMMGQLLIRGALLFRFDLPPVLDGLPGLLARFQDGFGPLGFELQHDHRSSL